jgi:YbbR domain-containing protein
VSRLSGLFTRNWTLKASAFGIALLLWFSVKVEAPARQEVSGVPVRVVVNDPGWTLAADPEPPTVTVRFTGPSGELARMRADRPTIVVPVESVSGADTAIFLRTQWIRLQDRPGVGVEDVQPPTVRLTFEPVQRMGLPPAARFEGALPDGLAMAGPPEPGVTEIRVVGPQSRMAGLDSVPLLPLDLSEVRESGTRSMAVDTAQLPGLQIAPLAVDLAIRVEARIERVISGVAVVLEDPEVADELDDVPSSSAIRLSGASSLVEGAGADDFRLVLRIDEESLPEPGEEGVFPLVLEGVPALLEGRPVPDEVRLRRRPEPAEPGGGGDPGEPSDPGPDGPNASPSPQPIPPR